MSLFRIIATVTLSLGAALGLGLLFGPDGNDPTAGAAHHTPAYLGQSDPTESHSESHLGSVTIAPVIASLTELPPPRAPMADDPVRLASAQPPLPALGTDACAMALTLTPAPAAMLALRLNAPCDAGEPVALAHGPLVLAAQVGADGALTLDLPALSPEPEVTVALFDGRMITATAQVPDFDGFHRVILTWDGPATVDLHAFVGAAEWDQPGHIRAGTPVSASSGFVSVFGDPELEGPQARVYTYPVGIPAGSPQVQVMAEAAVTPASCGRTLSLQAHTISGANPVGRRAITLALPDCTQPDGFVPLPSLLPDPAPGLAALN